MLKRERNWSYSDIENASMFSNCTADICVFHCFARQRLRYTISFVVWYVLSSVVGHVVSILCLPLENIPRIYRVAQQSLQD